FVSGTQVQVGLAKPATVSQVSSAVQALGFKTGIPVVQQISSTSKSKQIKNSFQIRTKSLTNVQVNGGNRSVRGVLDRRFGVRDLSFTTVGASFGRTVENSALIAIIASLLAISAYIALRFQWKDAL